MLRPGPYPSCASQSWRVCRKPSDCEAWHARWSPLAYPSCGAVRIMTFHVRCSYTSTGLHVLHRSHAGCANHLAVKHSMLDGHRWPTHHAGAVRIIMSDFDTCPMSDAHIHLQACTSCVAAMQSVQTIWPWSIACQMVTFGLPIMRVQCVSSCLTLIRAPCQMLIYIYRPARLASQSCRVCKPSDREA